MTVCADGFTSRTIEIPISIFMRRNAMALSMKQAHRKQEKQIERNRKNKIKKKLSI